MMLHDEDYRIIIVNSFMYDLFITLKYVIFSYVQRSAFLHSYKMGTITREELQTMVIWFITLEFHLACIEH